MQSAQAVTDWSQNHQRTAFFNLWLILTTENKPKTKNHTHMLITLSTEILHLPPNSSKILHKFSMAVIKNHSTTLRNWEHPIRGSRCEVWDLVGIAYEEENEKINTYHLRKKTVNFINNNNIYLIFVLFKTILNNTEKGTEIYIFGLAVYMIYYLTSLPANWVCLLIV
jgi:hypothetical protein